MKFVILLLCLIAHFVIMVDKQRIVVAVKITSDSKLFESVKLRDYGGVNGTLEQAIQECVTKKMKRKKFFVFSGCVSYQKHISKKPVDFVGINM